MKVGRQAVAVVRGVNDEAPRAVDRGPARAPAARKRPAPPTAGGGRAARRGAPLSSIKQGNVRELLAYGMWYCNSP
jgi:hypothetical protein